MKNYLSVLLLSLISSECFPQQWTGSADLNGYITRNGNIGTNGLFMGRYGPPVSGDSNPYMFYTSDDENHDLLLFGNNIGTLNLRMYDGGIKLGTPSTANSVIYNGDAYFNNGDAYFIGKLGVGLTNPQTSIDISGDAQLRGNTYYKGISWQNIQNRFYTYGGNGSDAGWLIHSMSEVNGRFIVASGAVGTSGSGNIAFSIEGNKNATFMGNVGIGTATPGNFKLAVNGKIWAQEVQVAITNPGPDYVFEPDYKLLSLEEIKSYIEKNKHLPEVPSAKEMETNGVNVNEMNMLLEKKIEELTSNLISVKTESIELKKEIELLKKK